MPVTARTFSFKPLRRATMAEASRDGRREGFGLGPLPQIWEVEILKVNAGDYHRVGDRVILELVS